MAFAENKISQTGASLTNRDVPTGWVYVTNDTMAVVTASGYFNNWTRQFSERDYIYIVATDGEDIVNVTSAGSAVPVTVAPFITSGDIADGSVTKPKLAAGVQPSHIVKFAGEHTTVGGGLTENITVTGVVAADDLAFCMMMTFGSTPVQLVRAIAGTNVIQVEFSADPSNDHVVGYQVLVGTS